MNIKQFVEHVYHFIMKESDDEMDLIELDLKLERQKATYERSQVALPHLDVGRIQRRASFYRSMMVG